MKTDASLLILNLPLQPILQVGEKSSVTQPSQALQTVPTVLQMKALAVALADLELECCLALFILNLDANISGPQRG